MLPVNSSGNPDPSQKSLPIKEDDKFYCRLLSKDTSLSNASFRVYYGVATGAVPFQWEAQPGTPKHGPGTSAGTVLPPLTPPPSYQLQKELGGSARSGRIGLRRKRSFRTILLTAVTPRKKSEGARDGYPPSTVPRSTSLSSCSSSVSAGSYVPLCRRRRFFNPSLSTTSSSADAADFHTVDDEDNPDEGDTPRAKGSKPVAVGCFGMARRSDGRAAGGIGFRGCFRMVLVKRTLLSMVGQGNGPTSAAADSRVSAA